MSDLMDTGLVDTDTLDTSLDMDGAEGEGPSAFEQGRSAGETGGHGVNPFAEGSPERHHFETGRKFGSRNNRSAASSYWQRRKT